jgi:RHS repeat-associated protein
VRRVYWYENQYLTNGGAVSIMSDSVRKYKITDYAGSTRAEIIYNSKLGITTGISTFDYKPYGDTLDASTNFLPVQTFAGEERDVESSYMDMGYRTYDPLIGRFLQVDPLNESFPNITPYCYSYNSPMTWSDPSGLLPEDPLPGLNYVLSILKSLNDAQIEETWHREALIRESNKRNLDKFLSDRPEWSTIGVGRTGDSFISSIVNGIGNAISSIGNAIGGLVSNLFGGGKEVEKGINITNNSSNDLASNGGMWGETANLLSSNPVEMIVRSYFVNKAGLNEPGSNMFQIPKFVELNFNPRSPGNHANQLQAVFTFNVNLPEYSKYDIYQTVECVQDGITTENVDAHNVSERPFYMTYEKLLTAGHYYNNTIGMWDGPVRIYGRNNDTEFYNDINVNWTATTSLMGQTRSGSWEILYTFQWGFNTDANGVYNSKPITRNANPTPYHLEHKPR